MAFIGGLVVLVKIMRRLQVTLNSFDVVVSIVVLEHTSYLSQTPQTASVEKKLVMWRNSPHDMSSGKILQMINVGKLCHMEKFLHMRNVETNLSSGKFLHIIDVEKICQVEKFSTL